MFGKKTTKVDLVNKANDLKIQESEIQKQLTEIAKEEHHQKLLADQRQNAIKQEQIRVAKYHLDVAPEIRIFYFMLFLAQNPGMTYTAGSPPLIHRYDMVKELQKWELLDYVQSLANLVQKNDELL